MDDRDRNTVVGVLKIASKQSDKSTFTKLHLRYSSDNAIIIQMSYIYIYIKLNLQRAFKKLHSYFSSHKTVLCTMESTLSREQKTDDS